jgi:hypothetical protein
MVGVGVVESALAMGEVTEVQVAAVVHFEEDRPLVGKCHVPGLGADAGKDGGCLADQIDKPLPGGAEFSHYWQRSDRYSHLYSQVLNLPEMLNR